MFVRLVLWDLDGSSTTIDELRDYLRNESVTPSPRVPGLRFKAWVADREANRWGALYLWESREAGELPMPSRARELIGKDPDVTRSGSTSRPRSKATSRTPPPLSRRGLAFARARRLSRPAPERAAEHAHGPGRTNPRGRSGPKVRRAVQVEDRARW